MTRTTFCITYNKQSDDGSLGFFSRAFCVDEVAFAGQFAAKPNGQYLSEEHHVCTLAKLGTFRHRKHCGSYEGQSLLGQPLADVDRSVHHMSSSLSTRPRSSNSYCSKRFSTMATRSRIIDSWESCKHCETVLMNSNPRPETKVGVVQHSWFPCITTNEIIFKSKT